MKKCMCKRFLVSACIASLLITSSETVVLAHELQEKVQLVESDEDVSEQEVVSEESSAEGVETAVDATETAVVEEETSEETIEEKNPEEEMIVEEIVISEADESVNSGVQLIGDGNSTKVLEAGDRLTATFNEDTGEIVFYAENGLYGLLISNWTQKYGIDISKVKSIRVGAGKVYFSGVTIAEFEGYSNLTSLDLTKFRSPNKLNFVSMFGGCRSLTQLDLSSLDTSSAEMIDAMFSGCQKLTTLNLNRFDTHSVQTMSEVFNGCSCLTSLDVSSFDTRNTTTMAWMFQDCSNLSSLNLSNFNTSNAKDVRNMFKGCTNLMSLDLSSFDTSKVESYSGFFTGCSNLQFLKTPKKNKLPIPLPSVMYDQAGKAYTELPNLTYSIILTKEKPDIGTQSIIVGENVTATFDSQTGTVKLTSYNGELWNDWVDKLGVGREEIKAIEVVKGPVFLPADSAGYSPLKKYYLFGGLTNLKSLDMNGFDTSRVTNIRYMFKDCASLPSLNLSNFDLSKVTSTYCMFEGCSSLKKLDLKGINTSKVTNMSCMFKDCAGLTSLDLSGFDTSNVTDMYYMFYGCNSLITLDLSGFDASKAKYMYSMFSYCEGLRLLRTPTNIPKPISLPRYAKVNLYDKDGNKCEEIPAGSESITLVGFTDVLKSSDWYYDSVCLLHN